nr:family 43 glycosylhydrolase [Bacteroides acidifaciens]
MKVIKWMLTLGILLPTYAFSQSGIERIKIDGFIGERINTCIEKRVKAQNVPELIHPFRHMTEGGWWQSEFFGKWMLGATASYRYTADPELLQIIKDAASDFMETQQLDGYIGNYKQEDRLTNWDIWGRKYSSLALLEYYRLTKDRKALKAVERLIDHLIKELEERNVNIAASGFYYGMASCSILEPVVYLYKETNKPRYLDFAKMIVGGIEQAGSSQLITKALQDIPVSHRSPFPNQWWSFENGQKAYEMMSCYEGLVELGKVLNEPLYLEAVQKTVDNILQEEINIAGSGAAFECWYEGKKKQTIPTYHTMETCVTFTWMQLCARLWRETANSMYMDEFERTMYNALMASMKRDGSQISKYSPLEGRRQPGEEQCGMHINCCNANGPRGFALIPDIAYQVKDNQIYVNLYLNSDAVVALNKNKIALHMQTQYPLDGKIELAINPQKETTFGFEIRIPSWAGRNFRILVNGEQQRYFHKGSYLSLYRKWMKGDRITMDFDLETRVVHHEHSQAVTHGPLVFARDSRFNDGDVDECAVIQCDREGVVQATLKNTFESSFAWITMEVPMILGTDLENPGNKAVRMIHFCDFASSGNDWATTGRYRVWIPETLHVMSEPFYKYSELPNKKEKSGNPIFSGWYADPEAVVFDNKYWIYPTSSLPFEQQLYMDAFSSEDLVNWEKHPKVLSIENISWLRKALWAPAVIEANGKYYFYFGANDIKNNEEIGGIGVAVADTPIGPFKDVLGKPLIGKIVNGAQPIDQFVFKDDDGQYYMYYGGWGHCNIVKMGTDLISIVPFEDGSMYKEVTPENYVEGPFMLKRNGKYYFMWSEGDWNGPDYSVAYAIADSPFGPFRRMGQILKQDKNIATGAGHHSIIKGLDKDEWYIVYHRHPLGDTDGNHRVTCIDRMYFSQDGSILPVEMTNTGVKAASLR